MHVRPLRVGAGTVQPAPVGRRIRRAGRRCAAESSRTVVAAGTVRQPTSGEGANGYRYVENLDESDEWDGSRRSEQFRKLAPRTD